MINSIVTGCAGFIGSHLIEELLKRDWNVTGIDNFHRYYSRQIKESNMKNFRKNSKFNFIEGSILSETDLQKLPKDVDYVFHYAALAGVRNSIKNPEEYFSVNSEGTKKLLHNLQNVGKFILASSSSVYGNLRDDEFPVKEDHSLNPISPYGESKKQAEDICKKISLENNLKFSILRFYTAYGPRQRPDEAITKFIRLSQIGQSIPIYGDGTKERDFTFVKDIVNGSILAAQKGFGTFNLGTGKTITINEMISIIEKSIGKKLEKKYLPPPLGDVEKTHADISKAQKILGFSPKTSFENGIAECVHWCNETMNFSDKKFNVQNV